MWDGTAILNIFVNMLLKNLSMLKSLKFTLDRKSLEAIHVSFIRPALEYTNILWAGAYEKDLTKLNIFEFETMRSVTDATSGSIIANLYKDTAAGWVDGTSTASVSYINCLENSWQYIHVCILHFLK